MTALEHWRIQKSKLINELAEAKFYDDPDVVIEYIHAKLEYAKGEIEKLEKSEEVQQ